METRCRSLTKVLVWRIIAYIITIIIFYLSTDDISKSVSVASIDQVLKLILHFFYERIWNKIEWGRIKDSESESEIKIRLRESSI